MTDFTPFDASTHPIITINDNTQMLAHGLEKTADYIVRVNGSYYEAIQGGGASDCGTIAFGGADNAGTVDGTAFEDVLQACVDALTTGGLIVIKTGAYTQSGTVTLDDGVTVMGETWGDDAIQCTQITRDSDAVMFDFSGDHQTLKNLFLVGGAAYTTSFITMGGVASRYNEVNSVTISTGDCKGIEVELSYWSKIRHIRGITLGDYLVYQEPSGVQLTNNVFDDIIAYQCDGVLDIRDGICCEISNVATEYFAGMTHTFINLESGRYFVHDVDIEGDAVAGVPRNCIAQAGSMATYINCRFLTCGDPATTYPIMGFTDTAYAIMIGCYFEGSLGWKEVYATAGCHLEFHQCLWDLGPDPDVTPMSIIAPFSDGSAVEDSGYDIDQAGEYARAWLQIPGFVKKVESLRIWGRSMATETDAMELDIAINGGADNEAYNTHAYSTGGVDSDTTNFAADDIICWDITDAAILALQGGDSVEVKVVFAAAAGANCATDCRFRNIELRYS